MPDSPMYQLPKSNTACEGMLVAKEKNKELSFLSFSFVLSHNVPDFPQIQQGVAVLCRWIQG